VKTISPAAAKAGLLPFFSDGDAANLIEKVHAAIRGGTRRR
jgi:hypothetical protein